MSKGKVIILARVSTWKHGQDESPARQVEAGRAWALKEGYEPVERIERVSGSKGLEDREVLRFALTEVERRRAVGIWAERTDRIGRDLVKVMIFIDSIVKAGGKIWIADVGSGREFDSTNPNDRVVVQMAGIMAEWAKAILRQASIAGRKRVEAMGVHCARPLEELPREQLVPIADIMCRLPGYKEGKAISWRAVARGLWAQGLGQPGKVIKTTGETRPLRPWPPSTLARAWARSVNGKRVQKPEGGEGEK